MCLRQQRIFLWSGFVICLVIQMIVLAVADTKFLVVSSTSTGYDAASSFDKDMVNRCLIFLPCVTFGLAADIQIIVSTCKYRPVAFVEMPYPHTRCFMLSVAFLSLGQTICTYAFCFLVFGGISDDPRFRLWVFASFLAKGLLWSPFLGFELYDTLFEQIYFDVKFQINYIKPGGSSRTTSPPASVKKPNSNM